MHLRPGSTAISTQEALPCSPNYQWSHAIDDDSVGGAEATTPQNQACLSCDRASSTFDMGSLPDFERQSWQLPFGKGRTFLGDANHFVNALAGVMGAIQGLAPCVPVFP